MNVRNQLTQSSFTTAVFVVSVILLFFIAGLSFRQITQVTDTQDAIKTSLEIRLNLEQLFSELKDAEGAHHAFLLTKDQQYITPYDYSQVRINRSLLNIRELIKNDKQRQHQFDTLYTLINNRFRGLRSNLSESRLMDTGSNSFKERLWREKLSMDQLRAYINVIVESERNILLDEEKLHRDEISFTPIVSMILVIFVLLVFLFTFNTITVNLNKVRELNQKLQLTNDIFNYAEQIGEISHWQYDIDANSFLFSDNKFNLIGVIPQSFEPSIENYLQYVHSNDRQKVRHSFNRITKDRISVQYRIITDDKKIRRIKSVSKLINASNGSQFIVGVDCDITRQYRNTKKLQRNNIELQRGNEELSSFNHIVSHDLQEPLRKIQMFISRITTADLDKLSEEGRTYFERIHASSERSQKLIDDLLLYSKINRNDQRPEICDLNVLLENAQETLSRSIAEKRTEINSDKLPSLKVTAHQIEQLFINLLSNSIKYAKEGLPAVITITYELVEGANCEESSKLGRGKYHCITFTDNGIGFDQDYSERIFVLFHRLHDRENYSGSGIGLAICKKMVENHNGYLFAYGAPDQGSRFKIYIPKS